MPDLYRILRGPLFQLEPELAHGIASSALRVGLGAAAARRALRLPTAGGSALSIRLWGIDFPNPVGLAAGFDKSGVLYNSLAALGFGHIEIGTVTAERQPGNPRPRLFRLPEDEALVNRMGFNNPGAEAVAERLSRTTIEPVLGINIGKSKVTPLEEATSDYLRSVDLLQPYAAYLVINVSSPNTPGLRSLQDAAPLRELVRAVVDRVRWNAAEIGHGIPVLVKLAPDLSDEQVDQSVEIALGSGAQGIVATNTTISRDGLRTPASRVARIGDGGLSGKPLRIRALEVVHRVYERTQGRVPIVGVGGIMNADDAWARIRAGASLIQLYTGFVYGGPGIVSRINRELSRRLRREGMTSVRELIGAAHR